MLNLLVGFLGKIYLFLLSYTTRIQIVNKENILPFWKNGQNVIYALWHSRIISPATYYYRYMLKKRNLAVIVSRSRDGEYISRVVEGMGFLSVRGSSSGGGSRAFSKLLALGRDGYDIVITPDGPRGPREVVKPGIIELSQKSGLVIVPVSCSSQRKKIFKSWDRFLLPFPFSKVILIFGPPLKVSAYISEEEKKGLAVYLAAILKDITRQADEMVRI